MTDRFPVVGVARMACFLGLMAPSLLAAARVDWFTIRLPSSLLDVAILVLLFAATASPPLRPVSRATLALVYTGALLCSVAAVAIAIAMFPMSTWPVLAALVAAVFACGHLGGPYRMSVPLLLAAAMVAKLMINAGGWLQEIPDPFVGTGGSAADPAYAAAEKRYPSKRYRLIHQLDGTRLRATVPHENHDEIHDLVHLDRPPVVVYGGSRHQAVIDGTPWVAVSMISEGFQLLDRRDLETTKDVYRANPGGFYFMGVAWDGQRRQIIGLRSDGRLYFFSYPDLTLVSEHPFPLPSGDLGLWSEQFNDLHLFADRYLLVSEQGLPWYPAGLVWMDMASGAARHVKTPGSPGGIVTPDDGETFLVVFFGRGILERRRSDDLSVLWSKPVGIGYRYMALLPDRAHVAVANYLTGAVEIVSVDGQARYGPFQTAPRVQDLAVDPQGVHLDVSHSQGITRLRVDALTSPPPVRAPADWFPYWLLRPAIAFTILRQGFQNLGRVAVNWLLVGACTVQFGRSLRGAEILV